MAYFRCELSKDEKISGTKISGGGGNLSFTPFRPTGGDCSGSASGKSTLKITFPESFDLSKYQVLGGTVSRNTITATASAGVSLSTDSCNANFGGFSIIISDK